MTILYAWANPLSAWKGADYTWVTDYPAPFGCPPTADYWYCWGVCHPTGPGTPARPLGSAPADSVFARCICPPNDAKARGGINLYGVEGVCHQLANRVLYATSLNGPPLTVKGAHKYWLSHFLFGTYGTTHADWAKRKKNCQPRTISAMDGGSGDDLKAFGPGGEDPDAELFEQLVRSAAPTARGEDTVSEIESVRSELLSEKSVLDEGVQTGRLSGAEFAERVNELVRSYLPRLAEVLGPTQFARIFEAAPDEPIEVVDPEIAASTDYGGEPEPTESA